MKTLYTSCYARAKKLPASITLVQISRKQPDWWSLTRKGLMFAHELAPDKTVWAVPEDGPWREAYRKQLDNLHAKGILDSALARIPDGAVLLCFETHPKDCHRGVLADYLNEKGLAAVKEWKSKSAKGMDLQLFLL